ncbi:MAG TPA: hypothetical protein QGF95_25795 [Candidatus Latescibacteria bacterium]|nr:hypothetical protein [Gemmatimonadaceae bacterium]MDP6018975.1 hypothetical protein [Candidatus Latescibacterota bacterium]HJP33976.1 hypothetical protein [Candidatus Latescibacterota bacterium]
MPILALPLVLMLLACGSDSPTEPPPPGKAESLVGAWHTRGDDPDLGEQVDVRLDLQESGVLRVTVTQPGGASLTFPGSWTVTDDMLRLHGAWFQPDGEVAVRCELTGDLLILTATDGSTQTWERRQQ